MDPLIRLQERAAHLERTVEELSAVVARQDRDIELLQRRVDMLLRREAEREQAEREIPVDRPPHY